ncbi:hypothetical protein J1614_002041 [Plenodomus biglobosus]|nr:hypothetical protein J1614_002041 [Plenodomus biglobosus]
MPRLLSLDIKGNLKGACGNTWYGQTKGGPCPCSKFLVQASHAPDILDLELICHMVAPGFQHGCLNPSPQIGLKRAAAHDANLYSTGKPQSNDASRL